MRKRSLWSIIVVLISLTLVAPARAFAERPKEGVWQYLQEVGVYSGYIEGSLKEQDDFQAIPLGVRLGFDLKPFTKKFGFEPKGYLQLVYEPFISGITSPRSNVEMGLGMLFKYAYPLTQKLYPFIEVGAGPYYMTLQTYEQSTQFNFVDQGGAGLMYFIKEDVALNVEYRYRHVSNAGIDQPNGGIEASDYLVGVSWYF